MRSPRFDRIDYNGIINGAYDYAQRRTSGNQSLSAPDYVAHDRFFVNRASSVVNAGQINISAQADLPPGVANYGGSARLLCNEVGITNNFNNYGHYIEGLYAAPLIGRKCVYQFWAKSNVAKNFNFVCAQNGSVNRRIGFDFQTETGLSWKKYQIPIDLSASGVGLPVLGNTASIELSFQLHNIGQATGAVNGAWVDNVGPFYVAGKDSFLDNLSNELHFAYHLIRPVTDDQYQAVLNGEEIEMEHSRTGLTHAGEFSLCQRYYEEVQHAEAIGQAPATMRFIGPFMTPKRANPILGAKSVGSGIQVFNDLGFNQTNGNFTTLNVSTNLWSFHVFMSGYSGVTTGTNYMMNNGADNGFLTFDAEL